MWGRFQRRLKTSCVSTGSCTPVLAVLPVGVTAALHFQNTWAPPEDNYCPFPNGILYEHSSCAAPLPPGALGGTSPGTWRMWTELCRNSVTSLQRQFLIKDFQPLQQNKKILLPCEKDGIKFGCRNRAEVWMFVPITKGIFFTTPIQNTPQWRTPSSSHKNR